MKCVFLDRDGVINKLVERPNGERTAPWSFEEFELLPNVKESIDKIHKMGYSIIVVTNQPDVNDGKLSLEDLRKMNAVIYSMGVLNIHSSMGRNTPEYKPNNAHVELYITLYRIDKIKSFMIGDRWKDIVCGHRSGLTTIFLGETYTTSAEFSDIKPTMIARDIKEAVDLIERII